MRLSRHSKAGVRGCEQEPLPKFPPYLKVESRAGSGCSEQGVLWTDSQSSPGQGLSLEMALKPWAETPYEVSRSHFSLQPDGSSCCCAASELALSRSEGLGWGKEENITLTARSQCDFSLIFNFVRWMPP